MDAANISKKTPCAHLFYRVMITCLSHTMRELKITMCELYMTNNLWGGRSCELFVLDFRLGDRKPVRLHGPVRSVSWRERHK